MDLLPKLTAIGFTEYEARVYLALLNDYPATGYQISKEAGVPRSMVYEALGRLKARGAVLESRSERASLYRPLPPTILLDNQEQAHRSLLKDLRVGLGALYESRSEEGVWTIGGSGSVLAYASQMIHEAERELYLVLDDPDVRALTEQIAAASGDRGVSTGIVLTGTVALDLGPSVAVVRHPPLESELHELSGMLLVVADRSEVLVASRLTPRRPPRNGPDGSSDAGEDSQDVQRYLHTMAAGSEMTATVTRNPNLVLIARQFVWMELFAQRIFARLGREWLKQLDPEDRHIFESI